MADTMQRFIKKNVLLQVSVIGLLVASLFLSFSIRTSNLPLLEGKYLLGTDSYRFLRQADIIISEGKLPDADQMRWSPLGRDFSTDLTLWSYLIAGSYHILHFVNPNLTLYQTACYIGLICYLASILFLYLLLKRIFDTSVALLAVNLIAVFPSPALLRSCTGFADRDAFTLLLWVAVIYFYMLATDTPNVKGIIYVVISGLIAGFLALLWAGVGLVTSTVAAWAVLRIIRKHGSYRDVLIYSIWYFCLLCIAMIFTQAYYNWLVSYAFLAITAPTIAWVIIVTVSLLRHYRSWIQKMTFKNWVPTGILIAIIVCTVLVLCVYLVTVIQPTQLNHAIRSIFDNFVSPLGKDRLMSTIVELQRITGDNLVEIYSLILIAALIGSVILTYRFFSQEPVNFTLALVGFEIVLCGSIVSLFPDAEIANYLYLSSLLIGGSALLISYILGARKSIERTSFADQDKTLWILIWFFIAAASSRQANRFIFFLDPVIIGLASYFIIVSIQHLTNKQENLTVNLMCIAILVVSEFFLGFHYALWQNLPQWIFFCMFLVVIALTVFLIVILKKFKVTYLNQIACFGVVLALTLMISADTFQKGYQKTSIDVASNLAPINARLQDDLVEIKKHTDQDSVIAAWWGYGSMINWLSKRSTIIDEDQWIPYWIHLMSRHVFAAQSEKEALEFLYAHKASHLMITTADIARLFLVTYNGSDASFDRLASISPFTLVNREIDIEKTKVDFRPIRLKTADTLIFENKKYLPGQWNIHQLSIVEDKSMKRFHAILHGVAGEQSFSRPPRELRLGDRVVKKEDGIPGTIYIFREQINNMTQIFYLSERAKNMLAVRLHFLQEDIPGFSLVYGDKQNSPWHETGIKFWKLNYPQKMNLKSKYLELEFPEGDLKKSWERGDIFGEIFNF